MSAEPRKLYLLRHGPTEWNEAGRFQGRKDIPLSSAGRELLKSLSGQADRFNNLELISSPLVRAVETAQILFQRPPLTDARLVEIDYGRWEGELAQEMRRGEVVEAPNFGWKGLDDRAPGGESLREVQERLRSFLVERAQAPHDTLAVTHKGVILALAAMATGWKADSKPPFQLKNLHLQILILAGADRLRVQQFNAPLK